MKLGKILLLLGILLALVTITLSRQYLASMAAGDRGIKIVRVLINPGQVTTTVEAEDTYLSALAYDAAGNPVHRGVKYEWGISSSNSIGQLVPTRETAVFSPRNEGVGNIYVRATAGKSQVMGSTLVTVVGPVITFPLPTYPESDRSR